MDMESARGWHGVRRGLVVVGAALLFCPALVLAQSSDSPLTIRSASTRVAPKPVCVYKGVMSDAEIKACTGHPVHYDYRVYESRLRLIR